MVLGKWLAASPRVLILDEPTHGIDVGTKSEVLRIVTELASTGVAVMLISSELEEVRAMSTRLFVMREGRLVAEFSGSANSDAVMHAAAGAPGGRHESTRPGDESRRPGTGDRMASTGRGRGWIRSLAHHNESGLVAILALVTLVAAIAVPAFRSSGNPTQILANSSLVVIVALGEALVIMARQIDLSVAAILGLAAYLIGSAVGHVGFAGPLVGIVLALALGAVLGLFNGVLIVRVRMPAIIATLATLSIYGGLQVVVTHGSQLYLSSSQLARQHRLELDWLGLGASSGSRPRAR